MFKDRIFMLAKTTCKGCGQLVCQNGEELCGRCVIDMNQQIDVQAREEVLRREVIADRVDDQIRKGPPRTCPKCSEFVPVSGYTYCGQEGGCPSLK